MGHHSVPACFAAQVQRTPDATAISHGAVHVTYRELAERADALAHHLLHLGVGAEQPVAVDMEPGPDLVAALLAVLQAGACYLPVHAAFPADRAQAIVDRAGCRVLLADSAARARGVVRTPIIVRADAPVPSGRSGPPATAAGITGDRLAYVMHTSGSSGEPKAVAVTHRGVTGLALDGIWDGGRHERVLQLAPVAFGVSTYEIWVPLLRGGTLVVPPPGPVDVAMLRRTVAEAGVTALHLTAGLFRIVAEEAPDCLAGLREVLTGGDVIPPHAVVAVLEACPDLVVRAMYGGTEVSSFAASSPMTRGWTLGPTVPLGRAMDGVELHLLDADGVPVGPGEIGELHVGGERLARGYLGRPDLTAERFVADPFAGGDARLYRTGDLMRRTPDGLLDFVGRDGDQVKIRGFRVEPAELEAVLAAVAGVAHAAVVARPSNDGHRLVAYVVGAAGTVLDPAALRDHAATRLPDYLLPSAVVVLPTLPLTPNGKLDRAALPEPAPAVRVGHRDPVTARQRVLCELFADVLGAEQVGIDDSFFDLGGQSMLAVRLLARVTAATGVTLSMADLFNAPTPQDLDKIVTEFLISGDGAA